MDPLIENLKSTTFLGKRFTRKQLADIQITVGRFPKLSRAELGRTICEHLRWRTPGGRDRLKSALGLLAELERLGILSLPPKRHRGRGRGAHRAAGRPCRAGVSWRAPALSGASLGHLAQSGGGVTRRSSNNPARRRQWLFRIRSNSMLRRTVFTWHADRTATAAPGQPLSR